MRSITRIILLLWGSVLLVACSPSGNDSSSASLSGAAFTAEQLQQLARLSVELRQQAALRAVKRLEHRFAQMMSAGRWQEAAELFGDEAELIHGEHAYQGKQAIGAWLQSESGALPDQGFPPERLYETFVLSPVLNLSRDGTSAEGRWRRILMIGDFGQSAEWQLGINENRYVLEEGQWKFALVRHYPLFGGPYAQGWRNLKEESQDDVAPVPFHYDVTEAGIPAPEPGPEHPPAEIAGADPAGLLAQLEDEARALLDEDRVISLVNAYGYYLDRKMWDDMSDLFHEQGTLDLGMAGRHQGREEIRQALELFGPPLLAPDEVFDHVYTQPVVTIAADGRKAHVSGAKIQMVGVHGESSRLGVAVYDNTLVKEAGVWKIDSISMTTRMLTDYEKGWAVDAQAVYPRVDLPTLDPARALVTTDPADAAPAPAGSIDDRLAGLQRRIRMLDAYTGTINIANAYGYAIDEFLWDDMADLFAVDGWKELSYIGRYNGRERVRQSVVDRYGRGGRRANSMTFHQKAQPVVTVAPDGMSAAIRTRLFQLNSSLDHPGSWMSGIYESTTVKEDGVWKLRGMDLDYQWSAGYIGGWEHAPAGSFDRYVPEPDSLTGDAAPDAPLRGVVTPPYPDEPADMAFHYRNPVSGREPPVLLAH